MLYKARNNVIKFYDDYSLMVSEAKHEVTKGTGLSTENINTETNASKITNSSCASKSRQ